MSRLSALFRASLETQQEDLANARAAERAEDVAAERTAEAENTIALIEQQVQFDRASNKYEDLADAAASLESVLVSLRGELANGAALNPHSAFYMNLAVDNASQRAGFKQVATPSMEQFQGHGARVATTISVEGVGERMREILEMVIKALREMWKQFAAFMRRLAAGIGQLQKRAQKLEEDAETLGSDATAGDGTGRVFVPRRPYFRNLSLEHKILPPEQGLHQLTELVDAASQLSHDNAVTRAALERARIDAIQAQNDSEFEASLKFLKDIKLRPPALFKQTNSGDAGTIDYVSPEYPGHVKFMVTVADKQHGDDATFAVLDMLNTYKVGVYRSGDAGSMEATPEHFDVLSTEQIRAVAHAVKVLGSKLEQFEAQASHAEKDADRLINQLGSNHELTDHLSSENARRLGTLIRSVGRFTQVSMQLPIKVTQYAVQTANAYLELAEDSFVLYHKKPV